MVAKSLDLALAAGISIIFLFAAVMGIQPSPLWTILSLLVVFLLPGYTLTALIFARHKLHVPAHLLIVAGISLAVVILAGFVLNIFPRSLNSVTWAWILSSMILAASLGAYIRRKIVQVSKPIFQLGIRPYQLLLFSLAGLVVAVSIMLAQWGARMQPTQPFTQLWIVPVQTKDGSVAQLGVENQEGGTRVYSLEVKSGSQVLEHWDSIVLTPGEKWETTLDLLKYGTATQMIEADLYRTGQPDVAYRHVTLQLVQQ